MARKKNIIPVLERTQVLATTCSSRSTVLVCIKFSTKLVITRNFSTKFSIRPYLGPGYRQVRYLAGQTSGDIFALKVCKYSSNLAFSIF